MNPRERVRSVVAGWLFVLAGKLDPAYDVWLDDAPRRDRSAVEEQTRGCVRCHGDGTVTVAAYAGLRRDPENDLDVTCPDCGGAG